MRKGLIDLKKEIEQELLNAKQVWINSFTKKFITSSPLPGRSKYATGYFVNQTDISIGSKSISFGLNAKGRIKRSGTFKFKRIGDARAPVTVRTIFKINKPYDKISITNTVFYNRSVEDFGWNKVPAYSPFKKATKTAGNAIRKYLSDKSKNYDMHTTIDDDAYAAFSYNEK